MNRRNTNSRQRINDKGSLVNSKSMPTDYQYSDRPDLNPSSTRNSYANPSIVNGNFYNEEINHPNDQLSTFFSRNWSNFLNVAALITSIFFWIYSINTDVKDIKEKTQKIDEKTNTLIKEQDKLVDLSQRIERKLEKIEMQKK